MSKVYVVMCKQEYPEDIYCPNTFVYIVDVVANDVLAMDLLIDCQKRDAQIMRYYSELMDSWVEQGLDVPNHRLTDPNLLSEFDERYDYEADTHEYWFDTWEVREK